MAGLESMIVDEKPTPVDREKVSFTVHILHAPVISFQLTSTDVSSFTSSILFNWTSPFYQ